jgi:hypothetical protein
MARAPTSDTHAQWSHVQPADEIRHGQCHSGGPVGPCGPAVENSCDQSVTKRHIRQAKHPT